MRYQDQLREAVQRSEGMYKDQQKKVAELARAAKHTEREMRKEGARRIARLEKAMHKYEQTLRNAWRMPVALLLGIFGVTLFLQAVGVLQSTGGALGDAAIYIIVVGGVAGWLAYGVWQSKKERTKPPNIEDYGLVILDYGWDQLWDTKKKGPVVRKHLERGTITTQEELRSQQELRSAEFALSNAERLYSEAVMVFNMSPEERTAFFSQKRYELQKEQSKELDREFSRMRAAMESASEDAERQHDEMMEESRKLLWETERLREQLRE